MTVVYKNKSDLSPEVLTNSFTFASGWTPTNFAVTRLGNQIVISGYVVKSSSIASGDIIGTLSMGLAPSPKWATSIYAPAHGGAVDKSARIALEPNNELKVRNPSASMTILVFSLTYFTD